MLKMLMQLSLALAGVGVLSSYLDPDVANQAGEILHRLSTVAKKTDVVGSEQAADIADKVGKTIQESAGNGASDNGRASGNAIAGRAFYNKLPNDCLGEKQIDLEGVVHCEQGRRPGRGQ